MMPMTRYRRLFSSFKSYYSPPPPPYYKNSNWMLFEGNAILHLIIYNFAPKLLSTYTIEFKPLCWWLTSLTHPTSNYLLSNGLTWHQLLATTSSTIKQDHVFNSLFKCAWSKLRECESARSGMWTQPKRNEVNIFYSFFYWKMIYI